MKNFNISHLQDAFQTLKEQEQRQQRNTYEMINTDGQQMGEYVSASNLQEAYSLIKSNTPLGFWKLKRCYNGGVRG
jgi:hypothetical protein